MGWGAVSGCGCVVGMGWGAVSGCGVWWSGAVVGCGKWVWGVVEWGCAGVR